MSEMMIFADHHNRYDFTEWNILVTVLLVACVVVGWMVKKLLKNEENLY